MLNEIDRILDGSRDDSQHTPDDISIEIRTGAPDIRKDCVKSKIGV